MKSVRFNDEIAIIEIPQNKRKQNNLSQCNYFQLKSARNNKIVQFSKNIKVDVVPSYRGLESDFWYTKDEIESFKKYLNCYALVNDNDSDNLTNNSSTKDPLFLKVRNILSIATVTNKTQVLPTIQKTFTSTNYANNSSIRRRDSLDNINKYTKRPTSATNVQLFKVHNVTPSRNTVSSKPNSNILDSITAAYSK